MMEYFDTNVYIYAFCQNVDNQEQKEISQKLLKDRASNNNLLVSEIILYEFAFSCKKLKEDPITIQKNFSLHDTYPSNLRKGAPEKPKQQGKLLLFDC